MTHRWFATRALAISALAGALVWGCAAPTDDAPIGESGDGTGNDEIVSEHSLAGSELPDHTLALSFDDGPGRRTAELAEYLATENIKATFFINGKNVPGRQGALDAVVGRGHLIGNHTQNHLQLTKLPSDRVIREVTDTDVFIGQVQPNGPWLLRPPFGAWNGATAAAVNGTPMKKYVGSVFWDVGGVLTATAAADWDCWGKGMSVDACGALYLNEMRTKKRGIVLMHDIHDRSVDMVKLLVPKLKAEGWKFTTIPEVPSVKRALDAVGSVATTPSDPDACSSATLGKVVPENACVQSRSDKAWHRCQNKEWVAASGPTDAACTGPKFPL